jgi:hypothetical protein
MRYWINTSRVNEGDDNSDATGSAYSQAAPAAVGPPPQRMHETSDQPLPVQPSVVLLAAQRPSHTPEPTFVQSPSDSTTLGPSEQPLPATLTHSQPSSSTGVFSTKWMNSKQVAEVEKETGKSLLLLCSVIC